MPAAGATAGAAVVCGVLALITACSSPPPPAHGPSAVPNSHATAPASGAAAASAASPAPGTAAPQLTPAQASQAFTAFLPRYQAMVSRHDAAQVPQLTTGAEALVRAFGTSKHTGLPAAAQAAERFFVPRLTAYPRWFVEDGVTHPGGATGGDLFVLVQSQPGGPWRAAYTVTWFGAAPAQLSAVAVDPQGYATAVAPGETSLAAPPGQLPAQYVRLLGGTAGTAAALYAPGDATTGWIATQRRVVQEAPADGWRASFGYAVPAAAPAYALRTTTGGALVFFAFAQDSTWIATSSSPKFSGGATAFDGRMPLDVAMNAGGLNSPNVRPGTRFASTYLFESLAQDPARGRGTISLLPAAFDGGGFTSGAKS
jgi:hypothetical protein